jgi:chaperonin GroES
MQKHLHPLNGYVLLKLAEAEAKTASGLYLPDTAKELPAEGTVEAKSSGCSDELLIGDRVLFKRDAGELFDRDGIKLRLVPEGDLLAKFVEAEAI